MKIKGKIENIRARVIYTAITILLLAAVFVATIGYIYTIAEKNAYTQLAARSDSIKEELNLQIESDRKNIVTMSELAVSLYKENGVDGLKTLIASFKAIGLVDNIGILLPSNELITRIGVFTADDSELSFAEEAERGAYTSGRIADVTNPERAVVRLAHPLKIDGITIAMLYGTIPLETLKERLLADFGAQTNVLVLERNSGDFIIDTADHEVLNITVFEGRRFLKGNTYSGLHSAISGGESGFTVFASISGEEKLYVRYAPLEISDWQIMIAEPYDVVFAEADSASIFAILIFIIAISIMASYVWLIYVTEKKNTAITVYSSRIRKILLNIMREDGAITESLQSITEFGNARSSFYISTDGEEHHYIRRADESLLLLDEDKRFFMDELFDYAEESTTGSAASAFSASVHVNDALKGHDPVFYDFLIKHGIRNVTFITITEDGKKTIVGTVNPKKHSYAGVLLEKVAVCFSMAIYNKTQLEKTEKMAVTDSLTGLNNRAAYNQYIESFDCSVGIAMGCIYIDVNELHSINNKHGHAAGDALLTSISSTLKSLFSGHFIYRLGGDEFLVFCESIDENKFKDSVRELSEITDKNGWFISVGSYFDSACGNINASVIEAEKNMYAAKARYYQIKNGTQPSTIGTPAEIAHINTGYLGIDHFLSVIGHRYQGVYRVNLDTDTQKTIIELGYLNESKFLVGELKFSEIYARYISEEVHMDYHRVMRAFLNPKAIKDILSQGEIPSIIYKKTAGNSYRATVYPLKSANDPAETLWVFEREDDE